MAPIDIILPIEPTQRLPQVNRVGVADIRDALARGLDDFRAMPTHVVFIAAIYPLAGILIGRVVFGYDLLPLLYPLAAGFALIGPFAAIGLYELSRRREAGLDTSWRHAFDVIHSPSLGPILALGAMLLITFIVWIALAQGIYATSFGFDEPRDLSTLLRDVVNTPEGRWLLVVGNLVGLAFAVAVLAISLVSFPLLLDRHVSLPTALLTSLTVVVRNPLTVALWGLIVAGSLFLGMLPALLGLVVVLPILGHSTWHFYRKAVAPDPGERPTPSPAKRGQRYAAQFPASLFGSERE